MSSSVYSAVFPYSPPFSARRISPAGQIGHQLRAVADAQNGNAEVKHRRVTERRAVGIDAVGAAGENNALIAVLPDFLGRNFVIRTNFGVDVQFAHTAGNQQIILAAEIQYKYFFFHSPASPFKRYCVRAG